MWMCVGIEIVESLECLKQIDFIVFARRFYKQTKTAIFGRN